MREDILVREDVIVHEVFRPTPEGGCPVLLVDDPILLAEDAPLAGDVAHAVFLVIILLCSMMLFSYSGSTFLNDPMT